MRLESLKIHNFRSVRELEMKCHPTTVLIGPNNHGKSNLLAALAFLLTPGQKPLPDDVFAFREPGDVDVWVEGVFVDLTSREMSTFEKYVRTDGSIRVRKTARNGGSEISYAGYVEEPDVSWLKPGVVETLLDRAALALVDLRSYVPESGKLTKKIVADAQAAYIAQNRDKLPFVEVLEAGPFLGAKTIPAGAFPDLYHVPAVRDLSDETKIKATTMFGRLVTRAVEAMTEGDDRLKEVREKLGLLLRAFNAEPSSDERPAQLAALEKSVEDELSGWGVRVGIEVLPPAIEKLFELGTSLHLDDGHKTLAEKKGHGLQRAVIFALLRAWAKALRATPSEGAPGEVAAPKKSSDSVVFAIEEPELFLHPHAQRRLAATIREIGGAIAQQVFLSTHSTHFVDMDRHSSICLISKTNPSAGTEVRQCVSELFAGDGNLERKSRFQMGSWINPDRAEMFFARHVVFVEGETERKLFPFLAEKLGCRDLDVTIVECGSKFNLCLYAAIANAFRLSYSVVHDEDPVPEPIPTVWKDDRIRQARKTFGENEDIRKAVHSLDPPLGRIFVISPDLEGVAGIPTTQGEKKGKALAALDHFEDKRAGDIPEKLTEVVRALYRS